MSTDNTNTKRGVLLIMGLISLFVFGSIVVSFNYIDLMYLLLLIAFMFRYSMMKKDV